MLKIRLARVGRKKRPSYRFIVSESTKDPQSRALEIVGHYDPFSKVCEVKADRIKYWISKGAQASPTAYNLLVDQNIVSGPKVVASKSKKKNGEAEQPAPTVQATTAEPAAQTADASAPEAETAPAPETSADTAASEEAK